MNSKNIFYILIAAILSFCSNPSNDNTVFEFKKDEKGVELFENNTPVLFYQESPKLLGGKYLGNNYIHPLNSLDGDTLTQESPPDHPHHRGVFWAWHQIYINGEQIADGWMMENISWDVVDVKTRCNKNIAQLDLKVNWKSPNYNNGTPFMEENTRITVNKKQNNVRLIDFQIALKALATGVKIGGSEDPKGYGGFSTRIKLPDNLLFTSMDKQVAPQVLQVETGPWMDFSGSIAKEGKISGISILCHPNTPNYPAPWILRAKGSMQNIVFPGQERVKIPGDIPTILKYRLVVHNGNATDIDISGLYNQYLAGKTYSKMGRQIFQHFMNQYVPKI